MKKISDPQTRLKVLMVSSEAFPFAKVGGLGDVVAQLSDELAIQGLEVTIIMPLYKQVDRMSLHPQNITGNLSNPSEPNGIGEKFSQHISSSDAFYSHTIHVAQTQYPIRFWSKNLESGAKICFVECDELYNRDGIYTDAEGKDYADNLTRFLVFAKASRLYALSIDPDIVHCHDWATAPVISLPKKDKFGNYRTVFSIHNIGYQGLFDASEISTLEISKSEYAELGFEYFGKISLLRSALYCADRIVAVSPQYAKEILGDEFGFGMQDILNKRKDVLSGILNGADYGEWNPATDPHISHTFSPTDIESKKLNKQQLLAEYKLDNDRQNAALIGIVSRFVQQKGLDIILGSAGETIRRIIQNLDLQFIFLGQGEQWIEESLLRAEAEFPNISVILGYNEKLSHRVQAASDFFLVPSRYEPCGLTQIYALAYGSIPIVSPRGGLVDTIRDISLDDGTGIVINYDHPEKEISGDAIYQALKRAIELWKNQAQYSEVQKRGFHQRFSWKESAQQYIRLYESLE